MTVESATLAEAVVNGLDLSSNAFLLVHGWTAGRLLFEFVRKLLRPLSGSPMTVAELAEETGALEGPLAITLRTCLILGFVQLDVNSGIYSIVQSEELDELDTYLRPTSPTGKAIIGLYDEVIPPFILPSSEASLCLKVWAEQRPSWRKSSSQALTILLDGVVLAPLLTSITYFARWDDQGRDLGKDSAMHKFDFGKLDPVQRSELGDIFDELGVGTMSSKGVVTMSSKGSLALQRCYSYYVPTSYAPMLAEFHTILFEDPGWGFVDVGQDAEETEIHIERTLNVVGSGAQHQTLFKDLMRHIHILFDDEDFGSQPSFVVDTGCGDGHLLMHVYEHVKSQTARGSRLSEYPLTMVGVDFNEESRVVTAINLSKNAIPHMVLFGDIGRPADIMVALKKKRVDLSKALHVRSFLDHDRPYIVPETRFAEDSAVALFARSQMADFVHLDKHGDRIPPVELFTSLVEHFGRWGDALEGSFGLCVLEAMMLDVSTTRRFMNDCVSFHFDIVQSLSRQYMTSSAAFCMGAAMAGLLPVNVKLVQTYPEHGNYCRVLNQHLVRKAYRIRFAEVSDLPQLLRLESLAWAQNLRASAEVLETRLRTSPITNLVCVIGDKVVAVLYTQRIPAVDIVEQQRFMQISCTHNPSGRIVQLIAIATDPEVASLGVGSDLRAFALHLARVDSNVDCVVGVTRARDFASFSGSMEEYVAAHNSGKLSDPIISFHTDFGARAVRAVPEFRPEDVDNCGAGVLVQYAVNDLSNMGSGESQGSTSGAAVLTSMDLIERVMSDLGYELDRQDLCRGFIDYGMDSLELVRIRNKLSSVVSAELPATLLLDYPTVLDLAHQLDKDRHLDLEDAQDEGATEAGGGALVRVSGGAHSAEDKRLSWDTLGVRDVLEIQKRSIQVFKLPTYQRRLADMAKRCYPDMMKYVLSIEELFVEVEGAIFLDLGLIDQRSWRIVQNGRKELSSCFMKYWQDVPEIRASLSEMLHITKQDQVWS